MSNSPVAQTAKQFSALQNNRLFTIRTRLPEWSNFMPTEFSYARGLRQLFQTIVHEFEDVCLRPMKPAVNRSDCAQDKITDQTTVLRTAGCSDAKPRELAHPSSRVPEFFRSKS